MNKEELERIYFEYSDSIYSFIYLFVNTKETAEDLTHDTFYKTIKQSRSFKHQSSVKTWLFKIARNVTIDYARRRNKI